MQVTEVTKYAYGSELVKLRAVYSSNNQEDNNYSKATPAASMELTIDNPDAQGVLVAGKSYYVDFTHVKEVEWKPRAGSRFPAPRKSWAPNGGGPKGQDDRI